VEVLWRLTKCVVDVIRVMVEVMVLTEQVIQVVLRPQGKSVRFCKNSAPAILDADEAPRKIPQVFSA